MVLLPVSSVGVGGLDVERYTGADSIWKALSTGNVRLLKMSWLIALNKAGQRLKRRQELPEDAFISVDELKRTFGSGNKDGVLPIVSISYCWLTPSHPDPDGQQLEKVATALTIDKPKFAEGRKLSKRISTLFKGFQELGIFWDWASLMQKDPRLWTPACLVPESDLQEDSQEWREKQRYEKSRSPSETASFHSALHETMDLWYSHQGTTVYMLTALPEASTREVGYNQSGWTTYERCSAEQIKKFFLVDAKWKLVANLGETEGREGVRSWPVGPDDFDALLEEKVFTNGADRDSVKALFRKMSIAQLGGIQTLNFSRMMPPTKQDASQLCSCLSLCINLQSLDLRRVGINGSTCGSIFTSLGVGALPSLVALDLSMNSIGNGGLAVLANALAQGRVGRPQMLGLSSNGIGDAGIEALAIAALSGFLASLEYLWLSDNHFGNAGAAHLARIGHSLQSLSHLSLDQNDIGDEGAAALAAAGAEKAFSRLVTLELFANVISDQGLSALAQSCAHGAFANLEILNLGDATGGNNIRDPGIYALCEACNTGGFPKVKELRLDRNRLSDSGAIALAEMCARGALPQLDAISMRSNAVSGKAKETVQSALDDNRDARLRTRAVQQPTESLTEAMMQFQSDTAPEVAQAPNRSAEMRQRLLSWGDDGTQPEGMAQTPITDDFINMVARRRI